MSVATRVARAAVLRRALVQSRPPPYVRATAILISRHPYSTEASTNNPSSGNFPPPGFNAEQAKRPLPPHEQQRRRQSQSAEEQSNEVEEATQRIDDAIREIRASVNHPGPTAEAKTKALAEANLADLPASSKAVAAQKNGPEAQKKVTVWHKVKKELHHYWDGTKLLGTEVRISFRLALKMAAGYQLSRREHRQLQRTVQDLGRLVPFSVFVIVPFAELLLPVALRLFPNLLPSTYEGQTSKDKKATDLRTTRKEVSNFLRESLIETGLPVAAFNAQSKEFTEFFKKVRATGESPSEEDVIKVCKIFKDDLTLDNLSRPQLVGMCRYMGLNTFGTDGLLRYQVRHRMRQIKRDDKAIYFEGVESLSVPEVQMACASRGIRTYGMSPARLREDLQMWLDLRLKSGVPSTLLVLSNAYMYGQGKDSEMSSQIDALQAVLSSIPEELFHEIELEVHNAEGAATNKQRLEVLKEQEELISEENEQDSEVQQEGRSATPRDHQNIDEKEERKAAARADAQASEAAEAEQEAEAARKDDLQASGKK